MTIACFLLWFFAVSVATFAFLRGGPLDLAALSASMMVTSAGTLVALQHEAAPLAILNACVFGGWALGIWRRHRGRGEAR